MASGMSGGGRPASSWLFPAARARAEPAGPGLPSAPWARPALLDVCADTALAHSTGARTVGLRQGLSRLAGMSSSISEGGSHRRRGPPPPVGRRGIQDRVHANATHGTRGGRTASGLGKGPAGHASLGGGWPRGRKADLCRQKIQAMGARPGDGCEFARRCCMAKIIYLRSVVITNIDDDGLALPHPSVQEEVVGRLEVSDECPARHKEDCWPLGWRFAPRSGLAVAHSPRPCAATGLHHDDTPAGYAPLLVQDIASNGSPDQPDGDRPAKRGIDGLVGEHVRFPPTGPDLRRRCRWPASEVGDQRDRKRICSTDRQIRARHDTQGGQHRSHVCVHHALGGIENRVESPPEGGVRPRYTAERAGRWTESSWVIADQTVASSCKRWAARARDGPRAGLC
eukprot:scaffold255291_cov29-Tisochrysis_lutea.AAC.3